MTYTIETFSLRTGCIRSLTTPEYDAALQIAAHAEPSLSVHVFTPRDDHGYRKLMMRRPGSLRRRVNPLPIELISHA